MAINTIDCAYPEDFELAVFTLQQQISDALTDIMNNSIPKLNDLALTATPVLQEVEKLINQILAPGQQAPSKDYGNAAPKGSATPTDLEIKTNAALISSTQAMEQLAGFPVSAPSTTDDEEMLANIGLILFDGVVYPPPTPPSSPTPLFTATQTQDAAIATAVQSGTPAALAIAANSVVQTQPLPNSVNNIDNLRRLYFARDFSLDATLLAIGDYLKNIGDAFVVQKRLYTDVYPSFIPDDEILAATLTKDPRFSVDKITKVGPQKYASYLRQEGVNLALGTLTNPEEISSYWFAYTNINNTAPAQATYKSRGYDGVVLSAMLAGNSVVDDDAALEDTQAQFNAITSDLNSKTVLVLLSLLDKVPKYSIFNVSQAISQRVLEIQDYIRLHKKAMSQILSETIVFDQLNTIELLRAKHPDSEIDRLLVARSVKSMDFNATPDGTFTAIKNALQVSANTAAVSSGFFARKSPVLYSAKVLNVQLALLMEAKSVLEKSLVALDTLDPVDLKKSKALTAIELAKNYLVSYLGYQPVFPTPTKVIPGPIEDLEIPATTAAPIGFSTMASPATAAMEKIDVEKTYPVYQDIDDALGNTADPSDTSGSVGGALGALLGVIKSIINGLKLIVKLAFAAINAIVNAMKALIMPLKKLMDSIVSKLNALLGGGNFNLSLFKCLSLNFDFNLSFTLFDEILKLLNNIGATLQAFISGLVGLLGDILEKILCIPINLLNTILGAAASLLAAFCINVKFELPKAITDALASLKLAVDTKQLTFQKMGKDCAKLKAGISLVPAKANQFKKGAACAGGGMPSFFTAASLNVSAGKSQPSQLPDLKQKEEEEEEDG